MYFAIKTIEGKEVNKILETWEECKPLVFGKDDCIYKSVTTKEEAQEYLNSMAVSSGFDGKGYSLVESKVLTGRFMFTRFKDENNGFTCNVYQNNKGQRFTAKGYYLPENKRIRYNFLGKYVADKKYGYEFEVESYEEVIEDTKEGIVTYLSSGVMKGVGEKKAKAIYEEFGQRTLWVLENEPERLKYVKGFSSKSAEVAIESLNANRGAREITRYLLKFGISQKYAIALYSEKKENALNFIKEHPYYLCKYNGLTFEDADMVARDVNFPMNDETRLNYALFYVLKNNEMSGNMGMELQQYGKQALKLLGSEVQPYEVNERVQELIKEKRLYAKKFTIEDEENIYIFSKANYEEELELARAMIDIKNSKTSHEVPKEIIERYISEIELESGFTFDDVQIKAIIDALSGEPFLVLTGGPGTGKTTIVKAIKEIYEREILNPVVLLAPTGRASSRIKEATGANASTIHSYLNLSVRENVITSLDDVEIRDSLIIVDEYSMVGSHISYALFSAIKENNRVVIVGDPDQLPSVEAGAVLRDVIESGAFKTVELDTIHRQKDSEKIVENANKINAGDGNIEEGDDCKIYETKNLEDSKNLMVELYLKDVKEYGLGNVMCLLPFRKHTAGVIDMNKTLQDILNPRSKDKVEVTYRGEIFRVGDLVMHLRNSSEEKISNGDIGFIVGYDPETEILQAKYNGDNIIEYTKDDMKNIDLAYATTIHKAQGSEAKAVVCFFSSWHKNMLFRNLPYVAISRGRKMVEIVGEMEAIRTAASCEVKNKRITTLGYWLKLLDGQFVDSL